MYPFHSNIIIKKNCRDINVVKYESFYGQIMQNGHLQGLTLTFLCISPAGLLSVYSY